MASASSLARKVTLLAALRPRPRNVISGNSSYGAFCSDAGTSSNVVEGNFIGTNAAGTAAVPNAFAGVGIFGSATNNTVGSRYRRRRSQRHLWKYLAGSIDC